MKKIIALLIFLLCFSSHAQCEKIIIPYVTVISNADLIVDGEILGTTEFGYEFKITEFIKGKSSQFIKVSLDNWYCDSHVEKHAKGQRVLLFLSKHENEKYKIINESTGELFVMLDGSVKSYRKFTYDNPNFPKINDVKRGVKSFLKSFELRKSPHSESKHFLKKMSTQSEIDKMLVESIFLKIIIFNIVHYYEMK